MPPAVASEIHAVAGDAKASLEALEEAGNALGEADQDDEACWIGIGTFNQAKLEAYHGVCYIQLGRPGDAVPALGRALDTLDPALKKHRCTPWPTSPSDSSSCAKSRKAASGQANR